MQVEGLEAIQPRSFVAETTHGRQTLKPSPNLLIDLAAGSPIAPNQVVTGDITCIPVKERKWAYLATWLDLYTRWLIGWDLDRNMRADTVLESLTKAEGRS